MLTQEFVDAGSIQVTKQTYSLSQTIPVRRTQTVLNTVNK